VIVDSLISRCENKNYANYDEYATVISILGDISNKRATQFILVALKDKNADVRKKSAEALGKIGGTAVEPLEKMGEPTVESLIHALKDEIDDVRFEAAEALGKIRDERAVEPLIQALKVEGESCGILKKAAEALGKIGEPAVESLIQALRDDDITVRYLAARTLGEIKDERAVEVLIPALKDEGSIIGNHISYVRVKAAEALGKIGEPAVELLIQALNDDDNNVRYLAAWALGEIRDKRAVESLNQLLNDSDANVRETAKESMKKIRKSS
jgi:HEAT repeat protein